MQFLSQRLKSKRIKLRNKQLHLSIRNSQATQVKSITTRLRSFQRRLPQIWQWRRNRKAFRSWRQLRYVMLYNVNRLTKIHQRSNFRLNKILSSYLNWRLQTSVNLSHLLKLSFHQNRNQYLGRVFCTPIQQNIGSLLTLFRVIRNQSSFHRLSSLNLFKINGKKINSLLNFNNSIISNNLSNVPVKYCGLTQETSSLLNVVLQNNINQPLIFKYNPRLQRHLNSFYLLHSK